MDASRSLQWLRGPYRDVEIEIETIRSHIRSLKLKASTFPTVTAENILTMKSMQIILSHVKSKSQDFRLVRPLLITCGLMAFQRFTGTFHNLLHKQC
jgi:facilitated trehalose transporter